MSDQKEESMVPELAKLPEKPKPGKGRRRKRPQSQLAKLPEKTKAGKGKQKRPQSQTCATSPPKKKTRQRFLEISNTMQQKSLEAVPVRQEEDEIDEIDLPDFDNVVRSGVQHVRELYAFYDEQQHLCRPSDYMPLQHKIDAEMRACLIHWMLGVQYKINLEPETLYLAVSIIDRFLSVHVVNNGHELWYVGISSLLIASKYEEDWAPSLYQFMDIAGDGYTETQVLFWEKMVLNKLEWYLTVPTVYMFLIRYVKAAKADEELERYIFNFGELGLKQYGLIHYCPSLVAASTVYAAKCFLQRSPLWTDTLERHTSFCELQLKDCSKVILQAHLDLLED